MKSFKDLTQMEIDSMSKEDFDNVPPEEKRSCYDCKHMKSELSWWCTKKEAIELRGTAIPGCIKCPFWKQNKNKAKKQNQFEVVFYKFMQQIRIW